MFEKTRVRLNLSLLTVSIEVRPFHPSRPAVFYASNSSEFVLAALESRPGGLAPAEIQQRLIQCGANALPRPVRRPWYLQLVSNFVHLFALLLWVGAFLAWLAGMPQLCWAIVVVILINGVFSYWQEYQAERAAEALQALLPQQVMVRREGEEQLIPASEVVSGDILLLAEGAAIPAAAISREILLNGAKPLVVSGVELES